MHVTDALERDVLARLLRDVRATLPGDHLALVYDHARLVRSHVDDAEWFEWKVVEDVQQRFHDTFVDVAWPRCPRHYRHPLWYRDGFWCCERDGVAVARLGNLASLAAPPAS